MMEKAVRRGLLFLAVALFALATLGAAPPADPGNAAPNAPERILVKFKPGTDAASAAAIHRQNGGTVVDTIPRIDVQVVAVPAGAVPSRLAAYSRNPNVQYAEPDHVATAVRKPAPPPTPTPTPNPTPAADTYLNDQWGMGIVQAPQAWEVTSGNSTIKIAILDTGIDQNHPDLSSKIVGEQKNFTRSRTVDDKYGHGTHVAGIAAAVTYNGLGVAGLGYNSSLMNVKVLDDRGSGYYSWIASGIIWAADNGAKVINMSLGGAYSDQTLQDAVDYAWGKGVVVVAAAGNDGSSNPFYPAAYDHCIAVGATDRNDAKASWSDYGADWVDVAAPGVNILSTLNTGGYGYMSGTSMASPHVAGLAGLVWATSYGSSNSSVRSRIESTTDAINAGLSEHGRINALNAVN